MQVERILGILAIVFGIILLSLLIPRHVTAMEGPIDPSLFPRVAAWLFIGLGALQCFASRRTAEIVDPREIARLLLMAAALVTAILLMPRIGFLPSSVLLLIVVCATMFERRWHWLGVSILAVPIGTWVAFEIVLARPLPPVPFF